MFNRFKSALYNAVNNLDAETADTSSSPPSPSPSPSSPLRSIPNRFQYSRPEFLNLNSDDEIQVSADHVIRPIIVPRDISKLPWSSGYAEAVNAGKSARNEDEAAVHTLRLARIISKDDQKCFVNRKTISRKTTFPLSIIIVFKIPDPPVDAIYFALFDGHAGSGASVAAASTLHCILHEKLLSILEYLFPDDGDTLQSSNVSSMCCSAQITADNLIVGALEAAFHEMDQQIKRDRTLYKLNGGCTALVALFVLGKLYVANAGDSRAVLVLDERAKPMSHDFTPETEKLRLCNLAAQQPNLLGSTYTGKEFICRPTQKDINKKMLYRDANMTGWSVKTIVANDLKFPVICGEGKRSRLLATIGVTRGFGDHDLKSQIGSVPIKPFLSSEPQVLIFDLSTTELTENDVLIMGTDGLWDVISNKQAADILNKSLKHFPSSSQTQNSFRYTTAAQDLVMHSRGKYHEHSWRTVENKIATIDDISTFVIPLCYYKLDHETVKRRKSILFIKTFASLGQADESRAELQTHLIRFLEHDEIIFLVEQTRTQVRQQMLVILQTLQLIVEKADEKRNFFLVSLVQLVPAAILQLRQRDRRQLLD
uniref:PPM-type phosphatase domain-containing protein n=1 Tax=Strigamia maritima TaxID=126957 RepID=T1J3P3_STRMM